MSDKKSKPKKNQITLRYGKNQVTLSPVFDAIMAKYELFGRVMSSKKFYEQYLSKMDEQISYHTWIRFVAKHNRYVRLKAEKLMERIEDKEVKTMNMEESASRKLIAIADLTLDEIINDPTLLNAIPVVQRMNWLFDAMKARDSRASIAIKKKELDRKGDVLNELLDGAQYGAVDPDQFQQEEVREPRKIIKGEVVEEIPAEPEPAEKKVEQFKPEDLEDENKKDELPKDD